MDVGILFVLTEPSPFSQAFQSDRVLGMHTPLHQIWPRT